MTKTVRDIYRWITIGGALSFIPVVFVAGPWAGYLVGSFLVGHWKLPVFVLWGCSVIGLIGSIYEIIRIIRFALAIEKHHD